MSLPRYEKWSSNFRGFSFNVKVVPSCLKHINSFYLSSQIYQCFLLPDSCYAAEIAQMHLWEVPDYLQSLHMKHFLRNIVWICFFFFRLRPFSYFETLDVCSTSSKQIINIDGVNVCPSNTPVTISKKLVSPSGARAMTFMSLQSFNISVTVPLEKSNARGICSVFHLYSVSGIRWHWRYLQTEVLLRDFVHALLRWFSKFSESQKLGIEVSEESSDFS